VSVCMKHEIITEKRIIDKDGRLGLHMRLTLRLTADSKADGEDILTALRLMAKDQDETILELVRKYAVIGDSPQG